MTGTIWPKRRKGSLGIPDCPREWPTSFTLTLAAWALLAAWVLRVAWVLLAALAQSVLQVQRAPGH